MAIEVFNPSFAVDHSEALLRELQTLWERLTSRHRRSTASGDIAPELAEMVFTLEQFEPLFAKQIEAGEPIGFDESVIRLGWQADCCWLSLLLNVLHDYRSQLEAGTVARLTTRANRVARFLRTMTTMWPEYELTTPDDIAGFVWTVRIPPLAYLRSMLSLFWSAIRHPLSETTIDLSTGRVLYRT
jgi:hypothetical protein